MSVWDRIKSFEFDKNKSKIFGIKSAIVWGNSSTSNSQSPLLYISKPRSLPQKEFDELIEKIRIEFIK